MSYIAVTGDLRAPANGTPMRAFGMSLIFGLVLLAAGTAGAAELHMYRATGCPYCAVWDQAIGPIYPNTEVGRRVPLRMADIKAAKTAEVTLQRPVRYSPTFVLVEAGREMGRIEGYPGEDFFWGLLDNLVLRLPSQGTTGAAPNR
jgi:hypothetical protein